MMLLLSVSGDWICICRCVADLHDDEVVWVDGCTIS